MVDVALVVLQLAGLIALLQGVAWMGGGVRQVQGSMLAPFGLLVLLVTTFHWLVPNFLS